MTKHRHVSSNDSYSSLNVFGNGFITFLFWNYPSPVFPAVLNLKNHYILKDGSSINLQITRWGRNLFCWMQQTKLFPTCSTEQITTPSPFLPVDKDSTFEAQQFLRF
jgi:hypothetical protein